jgi:uncharacterized membrane protein YfcA
MLRLLLVLAVGGFAGAMTGLMGASGVMAVVPGMIMLGYSPHQAIGTSLAVDMTASVVVAYTYYHHGRIDLRQGIWIALAAVLGAQLGSRLSTHVPDLDLSEGFAIFLLVSAVLLWHNGLRRELDKFQEWRIAAWVKAHPLFTSIAIGLWAGVYCGIFGAGGGLLFLFILLLLGYSLHVAVGTSTLIMALTTASGAVGYAAAGNLPYLTVGGVATGTVLGSLATARLANQLNERYLSRLIAVIFALLGLGLILFPLI